MSSHFHRLRVSSVTPDTDEATILAFDVPADLAPAFQFIQGQHLTLRETLGGVEQRRSYSICSGIDDSHLQIGVRKVPGGVFSTWLNEEVKPGCEIDVMSPEGRFFVPLDAEAARHYLCIAGGSGVTPILSIMRSVLAREPRSRVTLIYGNRRQRSTMFKEELEDLKNRYLSRLALHLVFSQEQADLPIACGRLDRTKLGEFLGRLVDPIGIDHAFVCGPHGVNDEAEAALLAAGVASERIHMERFGVPTSAAAARLAPMAGDAVQATIAVVRDGLTREIAFHSEHTSILDAASQAGLDLPFSCKSGVCCTCRAKLIAGKVRMERNFALDKAELAAGFVLTCQAHPLTERVMLSFDER